MRYGAPMKLAPCLHGASLCLYAGVLLGLFAPAARASDLTLDGGTLAQVPFGGQFQIQLDGAPGLPVLIYADTSPGPTVLLGESVPLGFTGNLVFVVGGTTDGGGSFTTPFFLPEAPQQAGVTVFLAGAVLDPLDPNGVDVSNGAQLDIVPQVGAGANQTTLVGRSVVLDGSLAQLADGTLAPGTSVDWQILGRPPGSGALLSGGNGLFPTLTPDVPGDYLVEVAVTAGGATATDQTTVHAFDLQLAPALDGSYVLPPFVSVQGQLQGPPLASFTLNDAPVVLSPTGDFGPLLVNQVPGEVFLPILFELQHADGSTTRERMSVAQGVPLPLVLPSSQSLAARLNQAGYDDLEPSAEATLAASDIEALLLAQGPILVENTTGPFGITLFSATVQFTGMSYSSLDIQLTPSTGGVDGVVSLFGVNANFDVWGEVVEIPYNLSGNITTSPASITATMGITVSGGTLQASVSSIDVDLQNFDFDLTGFIGSVAELFVIESAVQEEVENAIIAAVQADFPPAVEELLNSFVVAGNLFDTLEVDVDVVAPIAGVVPSSNGTTILLDGTSTAVTSEPGSPVVTTYRSTFSAAPAFGTTTPGGLPYGAGLAVADDFLNQVLAAATGAGLLEGDLAELFDPSGGGGALFTNDVLDLFFPGAGFDKFPDGTPVQMLAHGTMPPIVRSTPGGPTLGVVDLADLEIRFDLMDQGTTVTLLVLTLDASAELDLTIDGTGALTAILGTATVDAQALNGFPGTDLAVLDQGVTFLQGILLPQLITLFAGIPLPSLEAQGLGLAPDEVALTGGASEYVGFFGSLEVLQLP